MIDKASVFAERFKSNPQILQATVLGQGTDPSLDPYTALRALQLIKESNAMAMARQAQQPTSATSLASQAVAPQGLAAMMPMGAPAGQMPQQMPQAPQAPVMQAYGGLAGMPTPDDDYAEGGIVAFQAGGDTSKLTLPPGTPFNETESGVYNPQDRSIDAAGNLVDDGTDVGTGNATDQFNRILAQQIAKMQGKGAKTTSPEDREALFDKFYKRETDLAGPDIYKDEIARGASDETDRTKHRSTGEAMALLTAAGKVLTGNTLARGASEALPAYAQQMNEVDRADTAAKTANARMQFALKDAQRKERTGNIRAATAAMENYRKFQQDENKAEFDRDNAIANLAAKGITGNRARAGAGAQPSPFNVLFNAKQALAEDPTNPKLQAAVKNAADAVAATKSSFSMSDVPVGGPKAEALASTAVNNQTKLEADIQKTAAAEVKGLLLRNQEYRTAQAAEAQAAANNVPYTGKTSDQVRDELIAKAAKRIRAKGGEAAPAAQTALPMPPFKTDLKTNQLYNTNRGLAIWNGTAFVPQ